jgi:uncharacterized membrane protein YhaH (DUF805 family)
MMHDWYGRHGGMAGGAEWWQWLLVVGAVIVLLVVAAAVVVLVVTLRDIGAGRRRESHDPPRAPHGPQSEGPTVQATAVTALAELNVAPPFLSATVRS